MVSIPASTLSKYVLWSLAALWCLPIDVLIGHFDIASLAVNAAVCCQQAFQRSGRLNLLLGVDLEPDTQLFAIILNVFIDAGGAEPVFDTLVLGPFLLSMCIVVFDLKMAWLVLFMVCATSAYAQSSGTRLQSWLLRDRVCRALTSMALCLEERMLQGQNT